MNTFTDLIEGRGIEPKSAFKKFWTKYRRKPKPTSLNVANGWVQQEARRLGVKPDADGQISSVELTRAVVRKFESQNYLKPTGAPLCALKTSRRGAPETY